jgi:hypothetical protein
LSPPAATVQLHAALARRRDDRHPSSGCSRPAVAGDGAALDLEAHPRRSRPTSVPRSRPLRQPLPVQGRSSSPRCGRSTIDPVGGLTPARLYGGNDTQHPDDLLRRVDRPRSFRDDIQSGRGAIGRSTGRRALQGPATECRRPRVIGPSRCPGPYDGSVLRSRSLTVRASCWLVRPEMASPAPAQAPKTSAPVDV